jgi:hypothetical protein
MKTCHFAGVIAIAGLVSLAFSEQAKAITANLAVNDIVTVPNSLGPQPPSFNIDATIDIVNAVPTSVGGAYRSPWEGTALENTAFYTSIRNGTAGYNLTGGTALSLFWGSPDPYNTLTLWTGLGGTGDSVSILGSALGNPQAIGHHLVLILTDVVFNSVTFSSTSPAFEFGNLTATPIPAALPLFATGLGLMGWLARRRKRADTGASAIAT